MEIKNNLTGFQSFGMAFSHNHMDCHKYLLSGFDNKTHKFKKALKELDKQCDAHKYFDMFHSSHDNSIKIIGKTDLAGKILAQRYGTALLSLSRDTKHFNYMDLTKKFINDLEKSPEGPKNKIEKFIFKAFCYCQLKYAKFQLNRNPYEFLPGNVRKGVDIINELETKMQ